MCREAVLNIVRDSLRVYYVLGTRGLIIPARLRRLLRCHSMITLAMEMPNILKNTVQAADNDSAAVALPRNVTCRGTSRDPRSSPPHGLHMSRPAYPGSTVQHVPGVKGRAAVQPKLRLQQGQQFLPPERGPIQAHHHMMHAFIRWRFR